MDELELNSTFHLMDDIQSSSSCSMQRNISNNNSLVSKFLENHVNQVSRIHKISKEIFSHF